MQKTSEGKLIASKQHNKISRSRVTEGTKALNNCAGWNKIAAAADRDAQVVVYISQLPFLQQLPPLQDKEFSHGMLSQQMLPLIFLQLLQSPALSSTNCSVFHLHAGGPCMSTTICIAAAISHKTHSLSTAPYLLLLPLKPRPLPLRLPSG